MQGSIGEVGWFLWEFELNGLFLFRLRLGDILILLEIAQVEGLELLETGQRPRG